MLPFSRMLEYGNAANILPAPLVYLPLRADIANHGDTTNPKFTQANFTYTSGTIGTVGGKQALVCNGAQRLYYDEIVYANSSWTAMNWVYTTSTAAKAYINASGNIGFSYNTGGSPSLVRNFYCVNTASTTNSYFGQYSMPVNTWVHAVYSYDRSTNTLRFYADGVLIKTQSVSPTFTGYGTGTTTARSVGLGYYPSNPTATPLAGGIAGHRMYDYLLDNATIAKIYTHELSGEV
ncbi:virion structural protein [Pectobacterium phage vB_PcaM_CBB]|uniref:Structural protein n=1 Tax=Pectobacterium phage vB_PcaM_CBB TaxID=2772511 RepID=A0A1L2CVR6_9CAUD|nr:virion structural protein [Pectobacterium phage vB_PcaM_CBB]AMM44114.1 structural protein [Pectobacterium phage vB_PcaM_CBB]